MELPPRDIRVLRDLWEVRWGYTAVPLNTTLYTQDETWFRIAAELLSTGWVRRRTHGRLLIYTLQKPMQDQLNNKE